MSQDDFVGRVAAFLGSSVSELAASLADEDSLALLVSKLGVQAPSQASVSALTAQLEPLPADLAKTAEDARAFDPTASIALLTAAIEVLIADLVKIENDVRQLINKPPSPTLPAPFNNADFWKRFARDAVNLTIDEQIAKLKPGLHALLALLGGSVPNLASSAQSLADPTVVNAVSHLNWAAIPGMLTDPAAAMKQVVGWDTTLNTDRLTAIIIQAAKAIGTRPTLMSLDDPVVTGYWGLLDAAVHAPLSLAPVRVSLWRALTVTGAGLELADLSLGAVPIPDVGTQSGPPTGLAIFLQATGSLADKLALTPVWSVGVDGQANAGLRAEIRRRGTRVTASGAAAAAVQVTAAGTPAQPWVLGNTTGTRIEADQVALSIKLTAATSGVAEELTVRLSGTLAAYLDLSAADGMVTSLLGSGSIHAKFSGGMSWSTRTGFMFTTGDSAAASAAVAADPGLSVQIPTQLTIADILRLTGITVATAPAPGTADHGAGAKLSVGFSGSLTLGPVTASVEGIGLSFTVAGAGARPGNLGPLDVSVGFEPPTGWGLAVDAGLVSGSGFLDHDPRTGTYLGALALTVATISIQGVGVLDTKPPGGGWSLIGLADVGGLAIQLGFGIEITGLGVLVGVNRTMNVTGLQNLARSGALAEVMFPADLAANAPRVAHDLETMFPAAHGQYVFGPIVRLVWGGGDLVTAELAVFLELPSPIRIAILGSLTVTLPTATAPVANLHVDVLGLLDLAAKTVSLDMSLSHSSLAGMPLSGQAALRAGWGVGAEFVLAFGGYNPHFIAPAAFPKLDRLAMSMGSGPAQLRLTSYLAVTSNTLQFGAGMDLKVTAGPVGIVATTSFDALVQFKPFHLELDLAIYAAITFSGSALLTLNIAAHLVGPSPWQITGQIHFSILFFSFTIPISGTFGASAAIVAPATIDIVAQLELEIVKSSNWRMPVPAGAPAVVLRSGAAGSAVHPLGGLNLHQRLVPLHLLIDRFGADLLTHATVLELQTAHVNTADPIAALTDQFAPAQFLTMTDAEKLSAPSFEALVCGLDVLDAKLIVPVASSGTATSAEHPDWAAVVASSASDWDYTLFDATAAGGVAHAAASVAAATTQTASFAEVTEFQLRTAAAAVHPAASGVGPGVFRSNSALGIGPVSPLYVATEPDMASARSNGNSWFGSHAAASRALTADQQALLLSEVSSAGR